MGVGGGFWELLRPIARKDNLDSLRNKKLAIDLSYWVVQQETATKGNVRKPHLRLLFFRTINLVAKVGALPVFVVDGDPPPQKLQARLERFSRISGVPFDISVDKESRTVHNTARNIVFTQNIEDCVELLKLLGMPVLRAKCEAEGLCAELDREGFVNACVTPDSDAFLYGANCVIKNLQADFKEPLVESYRSADIESVLELHREHLVALALLAGCDYNMQGVPGIGCNNAMRLVRTVPKHEILNQLRAWGEGKMPLPIELQTPDCGLSKSENVGVNGERMQGVQLDVFPGKKGPHCSYCGHPGTKKLHAKLGCKSCGLDGSIDCNEHGCEQKSQGFKCMCDTCTKGYRKKMHLKQEGWRLKLCKKISTTSGFPDDHIIQIYLNSGCSNLAGNQQALNSLSWQPPQMEALERFLADHLYWDQIYVRQKVLPLLSRICLQDLASLKKNEVDILPFPKGLINGLYAPHSVERVKIFYSKPLYRLRWEQANNGYMEEDWLGLKSTQSNKRKRIDGEDNLMDMEEIGIDLDIEREDNCVCFTTDEDMILVKAACPELVEIFEQVQDAKSSNKRRRSKKKRVQETLSLNKQLSITSFFKAKKDTVMCEGLPVNNRTEEAVEHGDRKFGVKEPHEKVVEDIETVVNTEVGMFGDMTEEVAACGYRKKDTKEPWKEIITIEDVEIAANAKFHSVEVDKDLKNDFLEADLSVAHYSLMRGDYTPIMDPRSQCLDDRTAEGKPQKEVRTPPRVSVRRNLFLG